VYDLVSALREKRAALAASKDELDCVALAEFVESSRVDIENLVLEIKLICSVLPYKGPMPDGRHLEDALTDLHQELMLINGYIATFNTRNFNTETPAND
jgi:hypothetical protein